MSRALTDGEVKALFRQLVKAVGGVEAAGVELGVRHQRVSLLQAPGAPDMPTLRQVMALEAVAGSAIVSGAMARAISGDPEPCLQSAVVDAVTAVSGALAEVHGMDADGYRDAGEIRAVQARTQDAVRQAQEAADLAAGLTPGPTGHGARKGEA